jgi:Putative peptidoglycan binding domain
MTDSTALRPHRSRRMIVATSLLGLVAAGSTATAIALASEESSHPAASQPPAAVVQQAPAHGAPDLAASRPSPGSSAANRTHVVPSGGSTASGNHPHVDPTPPAQHPSAAIETLQRELGQLNYYEGPVTGEMNAQTTAAITYLQRDAHLPQTGTMNPATEQALQGFLAHGNNQMGS